MQELSKQIEGTEKMGEFDLKTQRRLEATAISTYLKHIYDDSVVDEATINGKIEIANDKIKRYAEIGNMLRMVEWIEKRNVLQKKLTGASDVTSLEQGFVRHAQGFSDRKSITYKSWREAGVPASVLKRAGVNG